MYQVQGILYSGVDDLNEGFLSSKTTKSSVCQPLCLSSYSTAKKSLGAKYITAYAVDLKLLDGDESFKSQHIQGVDTKMMCNALGLTYPIKNGIEIASFLANKQSFGRAISSPKMAENALKSWFLNTPVSVVFLALKQDISQILVFDGYVLFDALYQTHSFMVTNLKKVKPIAYQENKKESSWCITQQMPKIMHETIQKTLLSHTKER